MLDARAMTSSIVTRRFFLRVNVPSASGANTRASSLRPRRLMARRLKTRQPDKNNARPDVIVRQFDADGRVSANKPMKRAPLHSRALYSYTRLISGRGEGSRAGSVCFARRTHTRARHTMRRRERAARIPAGRSYISRR